MYATLSFSEFSSQAYVTNHSSEGTSSELQPTYQTRLSVSLPVSPYTCVYLGEEEVNVGKVCCIMTTEKILWKQGKKKDKETFLGK